MSRKGHGQIRQSQVITAYGPGALIDLPRHSAIIGGLDTWPNPGSLDEIVEPRLTRELGAMTGVPSPMLYAPPPEPNEPWAPARGIGAWRFPEWFVVQEAGGGDRPERSRRLVHRKGLDDKGRFDRLPVVPTRFVRACPRGHVDDLDWAGFVHGPEERCRRQLWLDEIGTTGDLADLAVRCECGRRRPLYEAAELDQNPLGTCRGARPWLGINTNESCNHPSRLLIRTASNAYFPQIGADAIAQWLQRPAVQQRLEDLRQGHAAWMQSRKVQRPFPGGPYVLLHTLSHLLIRSLAMRCGYPASSIRERVYVEDGADGVRYGILLYTGTPDAEGTLGGLVQQARHIEDHLADALRMGALCSNDPICAQHAPGTSMEGRWLHGSACHGCALIAETSCEMRNDYLDRALVVPVLGLDGAAFFQAPP